MKTVNVRESNFELLRLVCMFYILLHHFIVHGLKNAGYWGEDINIYSVLFNSFFVIAVNCFILISGYFGIKSSWKKFFNLYLMCLFYGLAINIYTFINEDYFSIKEVFSSFFPFSHRESLWFIKSYFYLFLLSPLLNKVVDSSSKRDMIVFLIILSVITFYSGWFWLNDINRDGFNIANFIFLYFIGRFIFKYVENIQSKKRTLIYLGLYVLLSLIIGGIIILVHLVFDDGITFRRGVVYNNPLVVISAVLFFLIFRTFSIKNKTINWAAKSSLAIYLIHENRFIREKVYNGIAFMNDFIEYKVALLIIIPLIAFLFMLACILIDQLRIVLMCPIENILDKLSLGKYVNKLVDRITGLIK